MFICESFRCVGLFYYIARPTLLPPRLAESSIGDALLLLLASFDGIRQHSCRSPSAAHAFSTMVRVRVVRWYHIAETFFPAVVWYGTIPYKSESKPTAQNERDAITAAPLKLLQPKTCHNRQNSFPNHTDIILSVSESFCFRKEPLEET